MMKLYSVFALLYVMVTPYELLAQNVGVGTSNPAYPLTVVANGEGLGIVQQMGSIEVGLHRKSITGFGSVAALGSFTGHGIALTAGNGSMAITVLPDGRVGIGTGTDITPYDLGVYGSTGLYGHLTAKSASFTSIKVGNSGTQVSALLHGTHVAGASATNQLTTTLTFPAAFSSVPKLFASVRHDPSWNVSDVFALTIKSVSTTQAVIIIRRLDAGAPWSQLLQVDWMALN
jgi:hypothetical protein